MNDKIRKTVAAALALMSMTAIGLAVSPSSANASSSYDNYYWYQGDFNGDGDNLDAIVRWDGYRWRLDSPIYFASKNNRFIEAVVWDNDRDGRVDHAMFDWNGDSTWDAIYRQGSYYCTQPGGGYRSTVEIAGRYWASESCRTVSIPLTKPSYGGLQNLLLDLARVTGRAVGG